MNTNATVTESLQYDPLWDHDDLCPMKHEQWPKHRLEKCWQCDRIAKVREDERDRHNGQSVILASECEKQIAEAQRDMLAKCIAAVKRLEPDLDRHGCLQDALEALRSLKEKP